jgi:hypothetical protein
MLRACRDQGNAKHGTSKTTGIEIIDCYDFHHFTDKETAFFDG